MTTHKPLYDHTDADSPMMGEIHRCSLNSVYMLEGRDVAKCKHCGKEFDGLCALGIILGLSKPKRAGWEWDEKKQKLTPFDVNGLPCS